MKRWIAALGLAAALALPAAGQDKIYSNSYMGEAPPALANEKAEWFNAKGPLTLEGLRGRVVYLEFSFIH